MMTYQDSEAEAKAEGKDVAVKDSKPIGSPMLKMGEKISQN